MLYHNQIPNNHQNYNQNNHQINQKQNNLFLSCVINVKQYNKNNIFLLEPIKNSIIERSHFIKIVYSDENVSINGICIYLSFKDITYSFEVNNMLNYNYKVFIDKNKNRDIINFIKSIEYDIFDKLINNKKNNKKKINYKLSEQLNNNFIKFTNDNISYNRPIERDKDNQFILKISGICETEYEYNLTYKFIKVNNNIFLLNN